MSIDEKITLLNQALIDTRNKLVVLIGEIETMRFEIVTLKNENERLKTEVKLNAIDTALPPVRTQPTRFNGICID